MARRRKKVFPDDYPGIVPRSGRYGAKAYNAATGKHEWVGTFDTPDAALTAKEEREAELKEERRPNGKRKPETVAQFAGRWVRDFPRPSATTNKHNAYQIRPFVEEFGDRLLDSIDRTEARQWAHANAHRMQSVRAMFSDAEQDQLVERNPFMGLRITGARREGRKNIKVLTEPEVDLLARCARDVHGPEYGPMMSSMVLVGAWTGMRPGEIFGLKHSDIDVRAGTIHVQRQYRSRTGDMAPPKNHESRTIALLPPARAAVLSVPRNPGVEATEGDYVFWTRRWKRFTGRVLHYYWDPVRRDFIKALDPVRRGQLFPEDREFDFYELRHFTASWLLDRGATPSDIAIQLGHKDNGALVMSTYGHPSEVTALERMQRTYDDSRRAVGE